MQDYKTIERQCIVYSILLLLNIRIRITAMKYGEVVQTPVYPLIVKLQNRVIRLKIFSGSNVHSDLMNENYETLK